MTAKATRSSALASTVAPTSRISENGSLLEPRETAVGYTVANAARRTPGIIAKVRAQAKTPAPVLPAETIASASPSRTSLAATSTDESGLASSAGDGLSCIATNSGA